MKLSVFLIFIFLIFCFLGLELRFVMVPAIGRRDTFISCRICIENKLSALALVKVGDIASSVEDFIKAKSRTAVS